MRPAFDREIDAILRERIAGPMRVSHYGAEHKKSATDGMPLSSEEKSLIDDLVAHIHEEQVQEIATETALEHNSSTVSPHHSSHNGSHKLEKNLGKLDKLVEVAPAHTLVINANFALPPSTTPQPGSTTTTAPSSPATHKDALQISSGNDIVVQLQNKQNLHQKPPHPHHLSTTSHPNQATRLVVKTESAASLPNDKHNHSQVPVVQMAGGSGAANNHAATLSLNGKHIRGDAGAAVVSKSTTAAPSQVSALLSLFPVDNSTFAPSLPAPAQPAAAPPVQRPLQAPIHAPSAPNPLGMAALLPTGTSANTTSFVAGMAGVPTVSPLASFLLNSIDPNTKPPVIPESSQTAGTAPASSQVPPLSPPASPPPVLAPAALEPTQQVGPLNNLPVANQNLAPVAQNFQPPSPPSPQQPAAIPAAPVLQQILPVRSADSGLVEPVPVPAQPAVALQPAVQDASAIPASTLLNSPPSPPPLPPQPPVTADLNPPASLVNNANLAVPVQQVSEIAAAPVAIQPLAQPAIAPVVEGTAVVDAAPQVFLTTMHPVLPVPTLLQPPSHPPAPLDAPKIPPVITPVPAPILPTLNKATMMNVKKALTILDASTTTAPASSGSDESIKIDIESTTTTPKPEVVKVVLQSSRNNSKHNGKTAAATKADGHSAVVVMKKNGNNKTPTRKPKKRKKVDLIELGKKYGAENVHDVIVVGTHVDGDDEFMDYDDHDTHHGHKHVEEHKHNHHRH